MFVIVPGVALLVLGLAVPSEGGLGMAIPGGIVLTVGLILAFQDSTGTYASWSYAWALVARDRWACRSSCTDCFIVDSTCWTPACARPRWASASSWAWAVLRERDGIDEGGSTTAMRDAMPFLAVALGVIIVVLNILPRPHRSSDRPSPSDTWRNDSGSVPPAPQGPAGS